MHIHRSCDKQITAHSNLQKCSGFVNVTNSNEGFKFRGSSTGSGWSACMCVCEFIGVWGGGYFPMVLEFIGATKKPDSEPSSRSIVEERIPSWLCKLKPSKLNKQKPAQHSLQLLLQHGLLHYETWQSQTRGWHKGGVNQERWTGKNTVPWDCSSLLFSESNIFKMLNFPVGRCSFQGFIFQITYMNFTVLVLQIMDFIFFHLCMSEGTIN